jgi:hypothetical protein
MLKVVKARRGHGRSEARPGCGKRRVSAKQGAPHAQTRAATAPRRAATSRALPHGRGLSATRRSVWYLFLLCRGPGCPGSARPALRGWHDGRSGSGQGRTRATCSFAPSFVSRFFRSAASFLWYCRIFSCGAIAVTHRSRRAVRVGWDLAFNWSVALRLPVSCAAVRPAREYDGTTSMFIFQHGSAAPRACSPR